MINTLIIELKTRIKGLESIEVNIRISILL